MDPPYKETSKTAYVTDYTVGGFTDKDQLELYKLFKELDQKGCKVMLSNSDTDFVKDLYKEYKDRTNVIVGVMRAVNCDATKRKDNTEKITQNC